jgi:methionyl-tRNA formyltransferase
MRVVFMGTPNFAVPALKKLLTSQHEVVAVYSQPPRKSGRGHKLKKSPIHILAEENGIKVRTPVNFKAEADLSSFEKLNADVAVVCAYGLLLPKGVLEAFKYGCINIHPSLLPRFRGAAPLQRTILAGDTETGMCIMQMNIGLDTGDILLMEKVSLDNKITYTKLHDQMSELGANLLIKTLDSYHKIIPQKQSESGVVYAKKIDKSEGELNFKECITIIDRKIRALNPWPGTHFTHKGNIIKILEADFIEQQHKYEFGKITNTRLKIACKNGFLIPTLLKKQGKSEMNIDDFLRGYQTNF